MNVFTSCNVLLNFCSVLLLAAAQKWRTLPCKRGSFSDNAGNCVALLGCDIMANELKMVKKLTGGFVKDATHVKWNDIEFVYSVPKAFKDDFRSGMELLESLQDSQYVIELVGLCHNPMQILTKFYKHGSADGLYQLLERSNFTESRRLEVHLQIAEDYLRIINFLHSNEAGPRVMCDSNDLGKTLSQYLITDDYHIVLGDLDALPVVRKHHNELIKCGHRELYGIFVAPEQLWPFTKDPFDDERMPGYDEKTDIWKLPDVLYHLLGDSLVSQQLKSGLFHIIRKCKSLAPQDRPTAEEILNYFLTERNKIVLQGSVYHYDEL